MKVVFFFIFFIFSNNLFGQDQEDDVAYHKRIYANPGYHIRTIDDSFKYLLNHFMDFNFSPSIYAVNNKEPKGYKRIQYWIGSRYCREIILMSHRINSDPTLPEEGRNYYIMGTSIMDYYRQHQGNGQQLDYLKSHNDFVTASDDFAKALKSAPWYGIFYREYGLALELAEEYGRAKAFLNLYLLTYPSEEEAHKTRDEITKINGLMQMSE